MRKPAPNHRGGLFDFPTCLQAGGPGAANTLHYRLKAERLRTGDCATHGLSIQVV